MSEQLQNQQLLELAPAAELQQGIQTEQNSFMQDVLARGRRLANYAVVMGGSVLALGGMAGVETAAQASETDASEPAPSLAVCKARALRFPVNLRAAYIMKNHKPDRYISSTATQPSIAECNDVGVRSFRITQIWIKGSAPGPHPDDGKFHPALRGGPALLSYGNGNKKISKVSATSRGIYCAEGSAKNVAKATYQTRFTVKNTDPEKRSKIYTKTKTILVKALPDFPYC